MKEQSNIESSHKINNKQYVIASDPFQSLDFTSIKMLNGKVLSFHKNLHIEMKVENDILEYAILGYAFQVDADRESPMEELKKINSIDQISDVIYTWAGRWLLIYKDRIFMDACGLLGCFYTEEGVLSSSINCINQFMNKKNINPRIIHHFGINYFPGPNTQYSYIKRLMPSQGYVITDGTIFIRQMVKPLHYYNSNEDRMDDFIKCFQTLLLNLKNNYSGSFQVPLTGGYDSRTLLALLENSGFDYTTFTLGHDNISKDDVNLPPLIAKKIGKSYNYFERKGKISLKRIKEYDIHSGYMAFDEDRKFYAYHQYPEGDKKVAILRANIWEVAWGYYYTKLQNFNCSIEGFEKKYINIRERMDMNKSLNEWILYAKNDNQNINFANRFYWEQRMGCWLSSIEQSLTIINNMDSIPLCNCNHLLSVLLDFDLKDRINKSHQVQLIQKLCPQLLDIPFASNNKKKLSMKDKLKKEFFYFKSSIYCLGIRKGLKTEGMYLKKHKKNIKKIIKKIPGCRYIINQIKENRQDKRIKKLINERKEKLEKKREIINDRNSKEQLDKLLENKPLISIVIIYNSNENHLVKLFQSLYSCTFYSNIEIIVIDNRLKNEVSNLKNIIKNKFDIRVINNDENLSYSCICNKACKIAKGEYCLFVNENIIITDFWLDEMLLTFYKEKNVGVVSAELLYSEGNDQIEKELTIYSNGAFFKDSIWKKQYMPSPYRSNQGNDFTISGLNNLKRLAFYNEIIMVSRSVFDEVCGFSEEYVNGYEDIDFCLKVYNKGYNNLCCQNILMFYQDSIYNSNNKIENFENDVNNITVFRGRWQKYLVKLILNDQISNLKMVTEKKLLIKIVLDEKNQCYFNSIKKSIEDMGYVVEFINKNQYNLGVSTDILMVFSLDYEIDKICNVKNDIIKIGCGFENNVKKQYDIIISKEDIKIEDNNQMLYLKDNLIEYNNTNVCDKTIDICGAMPCNENTKSWGDYHYAVSLKKEFERKGYCVNLLTREHWYDRSNAKYILVLRGLIPYYREIDDKKYVIMWNISHPADVKLNEYNSFDYVFFASDYMKNKMENIITPKSGVLLQCTDPEVMIADENKEKKYELLFIGNSRKVYRKILKDLLPTDYKLIVYGKGWDDFPVNNYVKSKYMPNEIVGQAYHDSKILLNDHWDDMKENGIISNRIFDALAANSFVISDEVIDMDKILKGSVVTYNGKDDLKNKIKYYLEHDEERNIKSRLGQEIVLKNHTFKNRVEQILKVFAECK